MRRKLIAGLLTALSVTMVCPAAYASTEHYTDSSVVGADSGWSDWDAAWETTAADFTKVSLTPGADDTQLNFAWYSEKGDSDATPVVHFGTDKDNLETFEGTAGDVDQSFTGDKAYEYNHVTVTGLEPNTTYYYTVEKNGEQTEVSEYKTQDTDSVKILYVGDPQIGASKGQTQNGAELTNESGAANKAAENDGFSWNRTLNTALEQNPDINFVISAGDQVNKTGEAKEEEYASYLSADALKGLAVATTIGNHDSLNEDYMYHFNNPNNTENGKTQAGGDYYYSYGEGLFVVLNTNNYNVAEHQKTIEEAVKAYPDAKWRIVTIHQDIYGSGLDHSDTDGMILRTQLTPVFDEYDIDVVLQGHDHTYSRTYQLQSDGQAHDKFAKTENTANYAKENNCYEIVDTTKGGTVVNPKGTVYLEANSATGSKFYNLITAKQDFISERSQTWTPSYSVVNVTDDSFEVTTYDADTGKVLDGSSSYKIVKKAEDTKKDDANSNTTKKDDTTAVQTKDQTITATASYKKSETSKAFKLNAKTNGNGKLTYTTSNKAVATVDAAGKVTVKGPGVAKITVKAAATTDYKAASKTVTVTVAPKKQSISLVNKIKKQLTIKWKKNTKASGYQVVYSTNKKFTGKKTVRKAKTTTSYKIKGLKKGKKYYVKVRSYKTVNGKRIYGAYSTAKKATIK